MARSYPLQVEGRVMTKLSETKFRVELPNGHGVLAHFSDKMLLPIIPILPGDKVLLEMSPYDLTQARITCRQQ